MCGRKIFLYVMTILFLFIWAYLRLVMIFFLGYSFVAGFILFIVIFIFMVIFFFFLVSFLFYCLFSNLLGWKIVDAHRVENFCIEVCWKFMLRLFFFFFFWVFSCEFNTNFWVEIWFEKFVLNIIYTNFCVKIWFKSCIENH